LIKQIIHSFPFETFTKRPISKFALICSIAAPGSNFNPQNIQHIPAVEIIPFLDLEQN